MNKPTNKPRIFCASCARRLQRGQYKRCPLGCGAALCGRRGYCATDHAPNCLIYQAPRGLTEARDNANHSYPPPAG